MGARQSRRSVDITTTPKKGDGEGTAVGEEKIEKLGDADVKAVDAKEVVTNGTAAHTDIEFADKDDEAKDSSDKSSTDIKENGLPECTDNEKETAAPAAGDQPIKTEEVVIEKATENGEKVTETPDTKKQKEKKKKKWSLRSISFSKKDKSKPGKDKEKNDEVEELNEEKVEETATNAANEAVKSDDQKTPVDEAPKTVTNGDASKEELVVKESEPSVQEEISIKKTEEPSSPVETVQEETKEELAKVDDAVKPSTEESVKTPTTEPTPSPVTEPTPTPAAEPTPSPTTEPTPSVEETPSAPVAVEEVKEVRSEEVPPPLPSSNPPSQVTMFAAKDNLSITETPEDEKVDSNDNIPTVPDEPVCVKEPVAASLSDQNILTDQSPQNNEPVVPTETETIPSINQNEKIQDSQSEIEPTIPISSPSIDEKVSVESVAVAENLSSNPESDAKENDSIILEPLPVMESVSSVNQVLDADLRSSNSEQSDNILEKVAEVESSPSVVETVPKQSENSSQDGLSIPSEISLNNEESLLNTASQNQSAISNLPVDESKDSSKIAFDQLSLETGNENSLVSVTSVPMVVEEKMPLVSSAGDVPCSLDSHTSLTSENSLQELKSNLNLKESSNSIEPSLTSEDKSIDLSTIAEVESGESILKDNQVNLPVPQSPTENESGSQICSEEANIDLVASQPSPILSKTDVDSTCNADESLPDLSSESLPSLPEPTDSILEPMSLPPLDSVPDPLVDDNVQVSPTKVDSPSQIPIEIETPVTTMTNGNATNGLKSSPNADDDDLPLPPSHDGPLKQIVSSEPKIGDSCENSQTTGDGNTESVEPTPTAEASE